VIVQLHAQLLTQQQHCIHVRRRKPQFYSARCTPVFGANDAQWVIRREPPDPLQLWWAVHLVIVILHDTRTATATVKVATDSSEVWLIFTCQRVQLFHPTAAAAAISPYSSSSSFFTQQQQ
jgi:hypothetical protein